ncbi:MAG: CDP-alcohol phosphatidyltransferase family protein [Dehalococcoidia bacterium]|nr:CDP-alcohol phosphatidyltransferase family protein [Dehalococcoidia bacterium]
MRLLSGRRPAWLIEPVVSLLAALRVTPAQLTVVGLLGNVGAAVLVGRGSLLAGGLLVLAASALDLLDGALARATGRATPFGALLDSMFDRLSEAVVLFGVLVYVSGRGEREQVLLVFVAAIGSLLVSYVRARAEGEGVALTAGLFTRPERVALLAASLITGWLRLGLWLLAVLTSLTVAQRLWLALRAVERRRP